MDRNLAQSSSYLIAKGYRGAVNVSKPRPGSARWEDFRRIGIDCRSALGGGRNGRPGIIARRGTGGGIRFRSLQNGSKAIAAKEILTSKIDADTLAKFQNCTLIFQWDNAVTTFPLRRWISPSIDSRRMLANDLSSAFRAT